MRFLVLHWWKVGPLEEDLTESFGAITILHPSYERKQVSIRVRDEQFIGI